MRSEHVRFPGSHDAELAGRLDAPDETPRAFALFAHCFTCTKDALAGSRVSRALTRHGIAVLRFDFTGLGGSDGEFASASFSSNIDDLVTAAQFLRHTYAAPSLLIGHSLGGAAALAAAERLPGIRAVATIGAPADTDHVAHLLGGSREEIEQTGRSQVRVGERTFTVRQQFLDDVASQPQTQRIKQLDAALLVMHSPVDEIVGVDNARQIFDAATHPKSFVSIDGADHLLTRAGDARFVADVLAAWAGRYVDRQDAAAGPEEGQPAMDEGAIVVRENGRGRYGQDVAAGRHVLTADEPAPVGHDTGPTPYDLLLAGLGACTSMTLRMYATRKEWPLEHVSVSLQHSRIHARDCEECETQSGRVDRIERSIRLVGDLDAEQRERLLEIADRCPVHRTLHSEVDVRTTMANGAEES